MVRVFSSDPQVLGETHLGVIPDKPRLLFVNGHWNRIMNQINAAPGSGGIEYWRFFLGYGLSNFISSAKIYFNDTDYQDDPYYIDGSSLIGIDQSGRQRKNKGYEFAKENYAEITKKVGSKKIYLISHSEGCAYAAGIAKLLIEKGISVGESIMLSADEGDEFSVEGIYPCYQIVAGWLSDHNVFKIDPVVGDHKIAGVNSYGVLIEDAGMMTVHAATISTKIFNYLRELKSIQVRPMLNSQGNSAYFAEPDPNGVWHKINDRVLYNKRVDAFYHQGKFHYRED